MGTLLPRLATVALAALALTACSDPAPTSSAPTPTTAAAESTPSKTTTSAPKVTRPKDVDLTNVAPCDVAKAVNPRNFGIDQRVDGREGESEIFPGSKHCTVGGDNNVILGVDSVVTRGFSDYIATRKIVKPLTIEGFPAAFVENQSAVGPVCFVAIDTRDSQMLRFQLQNASDRRQPVMSMAELCAKVGKIAEAGLKVVLAR